jgi:hypothetical protein
MGEPSLADVRAGIVRALQETDTRRALDSLEVTVVRAYLVGQGMRFVGTDPPRTIEGWLAWAEHCSPGS